MTQQLLGPDGDPGQAVLEDAAGPHDGLLEAVREHAARPRLGDVLVDAGVVTDHDLTAALDAQRSVIGARRRIGHVLVDLGLATERQIAVAVAEQLNLRLVDLTTVAVSPETVRLLPRSVALRLGMVVLSRTDNQLTLAVIDPTDVVALDDVRLHTGATELVVTVATESQVREHLTRVWSLSEDSSDLSTFFEETDPAHHDDEPHAAADNAPTVRLVALVLADAVRAGASDIHVEPQRDGLRIRYRVDGVLREVMHVPRSAYASVVSRLKIVSGLDISERRLPQDGRTRIAVDGVKVDARVSTMPSVHGEKVVIRLLTRAEQLQPLDDVGLDADQLATLRSALFVPQGLVLITGPTGSGKTSTLYSALLEIHKPGINIVTLEDPVEVQIPGLTQVQVHERSGLTFSRGLRAVLRQDPDVVLVGEVRDQETAELAVRASITGHLVLTTLHTTSAIGSITRLVDMGLEPYLAGVGAHRGRRAAAGAPGLPGVRRDRRSRRRAAPHARRLAVDAAPRQPAPRHRLRRVRAHRVPRPDRRLRGAPGRPGTAPGADADPRRARHRGRRRRPADNQGRGGGQGPLRRDDVRRGPAGQPAGLTT